MRPYRIFKIIILTLVLQACVGQIEVDVKESSPAIASTIVLLSPTQDTFLNINATNSEGSATLNLYTWPDYKQANTIILKFDFSTIPNGAVITSASLMVNLVNSNSLTGQCSTVSDPTTYSSSLHRVINFDPLLTSATGYTYDGISGWTPNTCCSSNIPLALSDVSSAYDTIVLDRDLGWKSYNAKDLVQDILNGAPNYGLLLGSDASKWRDCYRSFASSEDPDPNKRPYLQIEYQ